MSRYIVLKGVKKAWWHTVRARTSPRGLQSQRPGNQGVEKLQEMLVGTAGGQWGCEIMVVGGAAAGSHQRL